MKAMIFAAGLGTRLKPLTDRMPKALVPVGGRPLLQILLDRLVEAGCEEAVINVHHFAEQIIDYVKAHPQPLAIQISDERGQLLETGGGIRKAAPFFAGGEPFLVHNVDILHNVDLHRFYAEHAGSADAVLLVSGRQTSRYLLFDSENRLVGWTNVQTGEVKSPYASLDVSACHKYAFSGIHIFSPTLFPLMESWPDKFSIIDFYLQACAGHRIIGVVQEDLQLVDVGKLDTLARAEEFLHKMKNEE